MGIVIGHSLGIQLPCQMMIGVYNHLSKVFRFHYHSQKVIGSLGIVIGQMEFDTILIHLIFIMAYCNPYLQNWVVYWDVHGS